MTLLGNHGNYCFEHDFLLPLFGATFMLNLKFLAYAYREGKNDNLFFMLFCYFQLA